MRPRILYIIIYMLLSLSLSAQKLEFHGESLAAALETLRDVQSGYSINFIVNDLEQLPVHAQLHGLSVPDAVRRLCKGQPVKLKIKGKQIYVTYDAKHKMQTLTLHGSVQDARAHNDLLGATVELLAEDSTAIDTVIATQHWVGHANDGSKHEWQTPEFNFTVPAVPAHYIFRVSRENYRTTCYSYTLDRIGRREQQRDLPPFYLHEDGKMLREVTVTASRVRFYYKGDTLIYNASDLQLAEGSMLDGLLKQLPGVELHDDGRIYHNGKFVDDLLLNGKDFFRGDRKLMLENLPAYTVKEVAFYDKQTAENEWLGHIDPATQRYVIDVRLKKEYMVGWLVNVEAGTGLRQDETPYLGRLFVMRHSDHSRIAVAANANNLADNDIPGEKNQWNRNAANGLHRTEMATMDANIESRNHTWEIMWDVNARHTTDRLETRTTAQTFLPAGDTYEHSFEQARNEEWKMKVYDGATYKGERLMLAFTTDFDYRHLKNTSGSTAGLFSAPVADVSRRLLDDLYSATSPRPSLRDTLINRSRRESLGTGHDLGAKMNVWGTLKMKRSNDVFRFGFYGKYEERERQTFSRQAVNYGTSSAPPLFRHQYTDLPPARKMEFNPMVGYTLPLGKGWRQLFTYYDFTHTEQREHESIYRLDRLKGADSAFARPIGMLPSESEYQQVTDRQNSHLSHHIDDMHNLYVNIGYEFDKKDNGQWLILMNADGKLTQQHEDYERGRIDTTLRRLSPTFDLYVHPWFRKADGRYYGFTLNIRNEAPDLLNQATITDDTDPMNVRIGNPDLHYALRTDLGIGGTLNPQKNRWKNHYDLDYGFTHNAIGMGQAYDRQTGIRTWRPTNVNGNWDARAKHTLGYTFGEGKKHSADLITQLSYRNSVDLMEETSQPHLGGVQTTSGAKSTVHTMTFSLAPKAKFTLGKHTLNVSSDIAWDRYTGERESFQDISAWMYRIGADAIVHLPWQFDLTTDLTLYGRTGYADAALNTADLVWNARLARPFFGGKLLVMLDGFDILGQLSNVTRTVNAQGRTETYTNVLPRYGLLHVMYRFNKQPKKKKEHSSFKP